MRQFLRRARVAGALVTLLLFYNNGCQTSSTLTYDGKILICMICCSGGICTTTCV